MAINDNGVVEEFNIPLDNSTDIDFQPDPIEDNQSYEQEEHHVDPEPQEAGYEPEPEQTHEEEQHYEEEKVQKHKPKERDRTRERLNEIQREKYQALDENARLKAENQRLQQLAEMSSNSASIHYENSVKQRLDRARSLKRAAKEAGDVEAEIEADIELAAAVSQQNQLESWKAEREVERQYQPTNHVQAPQPDYNRPEVVEWATRNQWMRADSPNYDPMLAQYTESYANQLDNYFIQNGRADLIGSGHYFNQIDKFVANTRAQYGHNYQQRGNTQQRGQLNMRQSRSGVAPVRSGSGQARGAEAPLNAAERDLIRNLGITEKAYRQSKAEIKKEGK